MLVRIQRCLNISQIPIVCMCMFVFKVRPTVYVIWRRDHGLKSGILDPLQTTQTLLFQIQQGRKQILFFLFLIKNMRVRCTINRSHSTPCKKAEFEHLQIFPGHCLDFFLSVSGKICHSPIKKVKRQPTLIISFSQHSPFFGEQSKNPG